MAGRVAGGKDGEMSEELRNVLGVVLHNQAAIMTALGAVITDLIGREEDERYANVLDGFLDELIVRAEMMALVPDGVQGEAE